MKNNFTLSSRHTILEANINFYATPFCHPKRKMQEHDFIYMLDGKWKIGQNDEIFDLEKDMILILSSQNTHYGVSTCTEGTKTMYFHASFEDGDESGKELSEKADAVMVDTIIPIHGNKKIKDIFAQIVNCKLCGNQRKADICFDLLLCELSEHIATTQDTDITLQIKNIIHASPEKFLSNAELAKMANVSIKTAESKFKAHFGITIHQYMLIYKIDEAISYFRNFPAMTIKEVSYNLGFYDEYHFSKQFKKITGMSPTEYKNLL